MLLIRPRPSKRTPAPGSENFQFGRPKNSLVIITIYLVCVNLVCVPGRSREEDYFKKYINFTLFTRKLPPLGVGAMEFTISCLLILQMLYILNLVKVGPGVIERMLALY